MNAYIQIGFSGAGVSFSKNTRRSRRINRKYRKAAFQVAAEKRAYHHAA